MADEAPERPEGPARVDRRGTPPGAGTVVSPTGGRIGNPPFQATEEQRIQVRTLAKVCSQEMIATQLGISTDTLQRHFRRELDMGKAEAVSTIGAGLLKKAMDGNLTAMIFYLRTQGKWNTRVEHTGVDGGPIRTYDLSGFSLEQKRQLLPLLEAMMAQGGALEGEENVGGDRLH
jgi:hypothetical protein